VIANQRNQTKINQKNEPFISKTKTRLTNRKFPQTSLKTQHEKKETRHLQS
jgi:hypothetical protein